MIKNNQERFFEDFIVGEEIHHATPRTITSGDVAVYNGLFGCRFAVQSSDEFARSIGYKKSPVDNLLVFHIVFGKTVPDISLNAVANLGYANGIFQHAVYVGDTITSVSKIIGKKEISSGKAGIIYVETKGYNQFHATILTYNRWVMVKKREESSPTPEAIVPTLPEQAKIENFHIPAKLNLNNYNSTLAGHTALWSDYNIGEKIDHIDGITIEESDHMMATRLYQNTARIHFNEHTEKNSQFKRRLMYGGHIISLARSLSFNGLANAFQITAINGGTHIAPSFGSDTIYAWSEILDKAKTKHHKTGALRIRTIAVKNQNTKQFPYKNADNKYMDGVVLDFDYWALMPI